MYRKKQLVEVEIVDLADKDLCFGKLADGIAVFVQGPAAVGDLVRAEIFKIKKRHLVARLREVLRPSPHRIEPRCPLFGTCGGCKWQHMDYAEQLRLKRKQVADALEHVGGFDDVACEPCLPADPIFGYRNKMDFSFTDLRYLPSDEIDLDPSEHEKPIDFALGFHAPGCYAKALDLDRCDLATDDTNLVLDVVREVCLRHRDDLPVYSTRTHAGELRNLVVRHAGRTGELMVNLLTSTHLPAAMTDLRDALLAALGDRLTTFVNGVTSAKNTVAFSQREHVLHGPGFIVDRLENLSFRISPNSFFQTNTAQAEILYRLVAEFADPRPDHVVYDLFCGAGSITLFLADRCRKLLGIELVESAVADARANAERNGIENVEFRQLDLKDVRRIAGDLQAFGRPDLVVTDPPRAGMHPKALAFLRQIAPPAIVYVSCNPASLARDARLLCEDGLYRLVRCRPVDLFPQTNHVETVARFERTLPPTSIA